MNHLVRLASLCLVAATAGVAARVPQAPPPDLASVLAAAAGYVVRYSQTLQAVAGQEEYLQMDVGGGSINHRRRLSADVVFVGLDRGVVRAYRDIYAIDTKAVHPRSDRLLKLFEVPPGPPIGALQYAQRISDESLLQYVSPNLHVLDSPLAALDLLRREHQASVEFKLDSVKAEGGVQVAMLKFALKGDSTILQTPEGVPVSGRLWVEAASGTLRRSEIVASNQLTMCRSLVTFALDKTVELWLPLDMTQTFDMSSKGPGGVNSLNIRQSFEAHLKFSKYQQVPIDVAKIR